ncbi:WUSCHEL-related homeobox 11-like [Neltuma alba]|uniref:WUSCHEL-related homeobox 11-like n=1 Tax=Neltuma alba TaxID=207710 RepID=UPI0010A4CA8D|nr:WUSCHEL-related homeobox 11-like [Prosopis alba]
MEDQGSERSERVTVRSRWTPKPEQILILESIFNSGTVNPSKDETVRIRKLLEKFGTVADANVFYWFQNRRSRSRRRQRQLQQLAAEAVHPQANDHQLQPHGGASACPPPYDHHHQSNPASDSAAMADYNGGCSSSYLASQEPMDHHAFFLSADHNMGFPEIDHTTSDLSFLSGSMTVFINGVATEIQRGPLNMKTMFGEEVMLVHSSGVPLPTNEFGFLMQDLQDGESYFLVSKAA